MASSSQNHSKTEQQGNDILESRVDETVGVPSEGAGHSALGFAAPIASNEIGVLGPYRIIRELGRGGMGAVYGAIDTRLDRPIALKVMLPKYATDQPAKERFLREARTTARIKHDNVVTVYEADEKNGVPYIAMEFLEGYPLNEYLKKKGNLSLNQVMRIVAEASAGLAAAHKIGLVHRDIKPGNLWLEAPNGRVKVLDFGLAKPVHAEVELTQSGAIVGTPAYMSPEQARGGKVDHRTDLFSIGVLLYRLCTGKLPFEGPNTMAVLMALGTEEPAPVQETNPTVPDALAQLTHQLLAKKPEARPQTADEVVKRLRAIMQGQTQAIPSATPSQTSYAPLQVTAIPEANPFANLEDSSVTRIEQQEEPASKSPPPSAPTPKGKPDPKPNPKKKKQGKGLLIAGLGFAALLMIALGVIIIKIINKDGSTTEVKVPDDSKIEIDGKNVTPNPKKTDPKKIDPKTEPKKIDPIEVDTDRKAAKFVIDNGGGIWINGNHNRGGIWIRNMPEGDFRLTGVQIGKKELKAEDFRVFADCKNITALQIDYTPIGDEGLAHFQNSTGIRYLHLQGTGVTDKGLAQFQKRTDFTLLHLYEGKVTEEGLLGFAGQPELESLFLWGANITDRSLPAFRQCTKLKNVVIRGDKITDTGLAFLKEAPFIEDLEIGGIGSTQGVIKHVISQPNLSKLVLGMSDKVTAGDFQNVVVSPRLQYLDLSGVKTDAVDVILAGCKSSRLRTLVANGPSITPKGLEQSGVIQRLERLQIDGTNIGSESVPLLQNAHCLTSLFISKTKFTEADAKEIAKALPYCRIVHDAKIYEPYFTPDDLLAIEKTFEIGGKVVLMGSSVEVANLAALPKIAQPISLQFTGPKSIVDNQVPYGKTKNIRSIVFANTEITDVGMGLPLMVQRVNLSQSKKITDKGITNLIDCHLITHLYLATTNITDKALSEAFNWPDLQWLEARETQLTDKSLTSIKPCILLTRLDLGETKITDAGLAELADRRFLEHLVLDNTTITDTGLEKLGGCVGLKVLVVRKTKVTEKGVRDLAAKLPDCTITFDGGVIKPLTDFEREALANRKAAEFVIAKGGPVRVEGSEVEIWAVGDLPKVAFRVGQINLAGKAEITDGDVALFKKCDGLVKLILSDTKLTNAGLAHLKNCRNLDQIDLSGTSITNEGLIHLKDCTRLQYFYANRTQLTGESFVYLKSFKNLVHLHFSETKINDDSLAHLKELDKLTTLFLGATPITDKGLVHLKDIPQLSFLALDSANVTDEGLIHLKNTRIQILTLVNTKITDAGLTHLKDCKELKQLDVTKTKVTEKGAKELGNALPQCKISFDGGMIEPKVATSPDRKAAEFVIKLGGSVKTALDGGYGNQLPQGDFKLYGFALLNQAQLKEAELQVFAGCRHIQEINIGYSPLTDDGFVAGFSQCTNLRIVEIPATKVGPKTFAILAKQSKLERLNLDRGVFESKDLLAFQGISTLKTLILSHTKTDDEGIVAFKNCTKLELLDLTVTQVKGDFFKEFKSLNELKGLSLTSTPVTSINLTVVPPLPKLEALSLRDTSPSKPSEAFKTLCKNVKELSMPKIDLDDELLKALLASQKLTSLRMGAMGPPQFTDAGFTRLKELPFLESFAIFDIPITDPKLEILKGCQNLRKLNIQNSSLPKAKLNELAKSLPGCLIEVDEKGEKSKIEPTWGGDNERKLAEHIIKLGGKVLIEPDKKMIEKLDELPKTPFGIYGVHIVNQKTLKDTDLEPLKDAKFLQGFSFSGCPLNGDFLAYLKGCKNLRRISLISREAKGSSLKHLADIRTIEELNLTNVKLTDADLEAIKNWQFLKTVHLGGTLITNAGVAHLKNCLDLEQLELIGRSAITDEAMSVIENHQKLQTLRLTGTTITDAGLAKLTGCSNLRFLDLVGTKVTVEGIKKLAQQLPQCQITHEKIVIQPHKPLTQEERLKLTRLLIDEGNLLIKPIDREPYQAWNAKQLADVVDKDFSILRIHYSEKVNLSPEVLAALAQMSEIKAFNASGAVLPANLLDTLSTLPELEELILDKTNLDDKSVETLKQFKGLKLLKVSGTKISETGAKAIGAALPNCTIVYEGGGIEPKR